MAKWSLQTGLLPVFCPIDNTLIDTMTLYCYILFHVVTTGWFGSELKAKTERKLSYIILQD